MHAQTKPQVKYYSPHRHKYTVARKEHQNKIYD